MAYAVAFGIVLTTGVMLSTVPRLLGRVGSKASARALTHSLSGILALAMALLVDNKIAILIADVSTVPGLALAMELGLPGSMQETSPLKPLDGIWMGLREAPGLERGGTAIANGSGQIVNKTYNQLGPAAR